MRIGIDLMGSDNSPHQLFNAVLQAAEILGGSCSFFVIATKGVVEQLNSTNYKSFSPAISASINFCEVDDAIGMDDAPISVRHKKGSSLMVGMNLLKKKQLDAFVSCGNTGALIASAALSLPKLPGISRPALLATLPTEKGPIIVLDVGSTVASKARYLIQFAHLGAAYQRAFNGIHAPTVGLLNVGAESGKGTAEIREAYEVLKAEAEKQVVAGFPAKMNFIGNIEGRDVFKGVVEVLVTDGFTGNILLKSAEGVAAFIFNSLEKSVQVHTPKIFQEALKDLKKQFNYTEYPGAMVCGVEGIIVKVHGTGNSHALLSSILGAANCIQKNIVALIKEQLLSQQAAAN